MSAEHAEWPPRFQFASDVWPGLAKLSEECGEVVQVVGKIIGTAGTMEFRDGRKVGRERLVDELGDLTAIAQFVIDHALTKDERTEVTRRARRKRAQFKEWRKTELLPQ